MENEDKRGWGEGREVECRHEIERLGMKTPPEMTDDNSKAHSRPAFRTDLSHTYNDDDVSHGPFLPLG